ncbi:MAG TPA: hypothetical protein VFC19_12250, partial [Candidatus Limnocylindrales bacterium]|nr:hypothetical protein [Candidatus Limnocylindrales bacterium]
MGSSSRSRFQQRLAVGDVPVEAVIGRIEPDGRRPDGHRCDAGLADHVERGAARSPIRLDNEPCS